METSCYIERVSMSKEELKKMYPAGRGCLHIPLPDFMAMQFTSGEEMITTLKGLMRLHGVEIDPNDDTFEIKITTIFDSVRATVPIPVVKVESYQEIPF